jgi:hypothetical protein
MSWLAANWFGVCAVFAAPAAVGIFCWVVAHYVMGEGERHYREREARKRSHFQLSRTSRRR